jgi:hypothetical protein
MKKWANKLYRALSKEDVQMVKKHRNKCSTSLTIKKIQIKTTIRFHLSPVRIATIKNTTIHLGKDEGKKEPSYTAGGDVN